MPRTLHLSHRLKSAEQRLEPMLSAFRISQVPRRQERSRLANGGINDEAMEAEEQADGRLVAGW